jgi:hypothetical protein
MASVARRGHFVYIREIVILFLTRLAMYHGNRTGALAL